MQKESASSTIIRFSTFELDVRAGELRQQGAKIRIQDQPLRILEMLLAHPGQLVTREELRSRLWSSDTIADFDHSLNKAINKLREALGDSAETSRFVETIPRRGYRFTAVREPPILAAVPTNNLPQQITSFIGREREQAEVISSPATSPTEPIRPSVSPPCWKLIRTSRLLITCRAISPCSPLGRPSFRSPIRRCSQTWEKKGPD